MQSELKSLSKIFSECIFRIPDYQRGYSWTQKQLKDFWNDILQLQIGKSHYTGVLTLEPVRELDYLKWVDDVWIIRSKLYSALYVVDGQQRLTTAIILLQCILEKMADDDVLNYTSKADIKKKYIFESKDKGISKSYIFGYETDNPSREFLTQSILGEDLEVHALPESTIYTKNLAAAKTYFAAQLKDLDLQSVEEIYTKLTQHLQFNIFYIEPELDVFVTFETMNNRGKPLSQLELLKNRLIYLSTKFTEEKSEQERLRRKINESWKSIYSHLGRKPTRALDDDLFLKTHFLSYFGPDLPKNDEDDSEETEYDLFKFIHRDDLFKNFLLEQTFSARRLYAPENDAPLTVTELDNYAQDIKKSVELYYKIANPEDSDLPEAEKILLQRLARSRRDDARLLSLVVMQTIKETERRQNLFSIVEKFCFFSHLKAYSFRMIHILNYAVKLKAADLTPEEVARNIESTCKSFIESKDFHEAIRGIGKSEGYYGWAGLRYFMYEYEQELRKKTKTARQILNWENFQSENYDVDHRSIEHVFPQKASNPYWREAFQKYSVPERNVLRNSLGNLLPVSLAKNSSLSNKSFLDKCGNAQNQIGYSYGCLSEIQVSMQREWTASLILSRGLHLLEFMERRWGFSLGSVDRKIDLLGLSFVPSREGLSPESFPKIFIDHKIQDTIIKN